jgi:alkylation response protein AidB-like acyl-CoA dehydrogenase
LSNVSSEPSEDEHFVRGLTRALIRDHADDTETNFLGAQFDAGLAWVHWAVGDGGLGLPPGLQRHIDEELEVVGRRVPWRRNPMGVGMVGPAIAVHGTPEQRRLHLRPIFTAEDIWCQLFSEPGAGSDVATLATSAAHMDDGWIVNGQKVWTSAGNEARFGLLLARTDPRAPKHKGLTAFILDMSTPGVEVRPLRQMTGRANFSEVYFTDAQLGDRSRIGEPGGGWGVAVTTLMNERVSIGGVVEPRGSGAIGAATSAFRTSSAAERYRDSFLRLWVRAEVQRLGNVRAQQSRLQGTPGPEGSILKLAAALLDQEIQSLTISLLGPDGMLGDGYGPERPQEGSSAEAFLQAQCSTIAGGTSEIMRSIIGERILGLPREPQVDKQLPWNEIHRS